MNFVDQVDLITTAGRRILHVLQQLAGIFHFGTRRRIHFNQINKTPLGDFTATGTLAAGLRANTGFTIEAFGENPRDGGLTHTAGTSEEISVVQAVMIQRINKCLQDMLLPDHFPEHTRAPLARQNLIAHANCCSLYVKCAGCKNRARL